MTDGEVLLTYSNKSVEKSIKSQLMVLMTPDNVTKTVRIKRTVPLIPPRKRAIF
ncbi:hypothetical protein BTN50_0725 [Candidatus Enterovibrio altilux]|uniref:Uncharacterized protein n=1 Tax=Candidatus Enterovibrio altilux TaxID=1927128 RepID=A0A291B899_9GAMM|nr:hypothetical protein BTN50_0725 [Candidatus Enterovibrio luxaltus]